MASDNAPPPHDPPPAYLRQGRIEPPQQQRQQQRREPENTVGRRWAVPALIAWVTLSAFAGALWFAYEQGVRQGMQATPPLIKADASPVKVPPDDPGGMDVPHQDKEIYERMAGGDGAGQEEARLRPDSERPAPKEELLAAAQTKEEPAGSTTIPVPPLPKVVDAQASEAPAQSAAAQSEPETREATASAAVTDDSDDAKLPPPVPLVPKAAPSTASESGGSAAASRQSAAVQAPASLPPIGASYRVQLGAYRSTEAAEGAWRLLQGQEEALLGSLDHLVQRADLGARGIYYRLQAGPLDGPGAARAMCNKLQQRQLGCLVIRPATR